MWLKMYVGRLLISKYEIEFSEMDSMEEKINHAKNLANRMLIDNLSIIEDKSEGPVFFLDNVQSKMNDADYVNPFEDASDTYIRLFYAIMNTDEMRKKRKQI